MDLSVIIVTYNSAPTISNCLHSVRQQEGVPFEILVVDNASADDTVQRVRALGAGIELLANPRNIGFGRACNQGAAASKGKILFLLNPDAQIQGTDALASIAEAFQENPRWGIAGTRIVRPDGRVEKFGEPNYPGERHFHCDFSHLPGKLAWVLGASMGLRREVFFAVDGFDPGFFLYSEETDLCLRVRQAGWEIGFLPQVTVRHIGGVSERDADPYDMWLRRMTGVHRFWAKHYPSRDVRRIVRLDWFRASFRREWYNLARRLQGPQSRAWLKHREYAAISEASRRFLWENYPR
jgi:hypothetical protein